MTWVFALVVSAAAAAPGGNGCVRCHEAEVLPVTLGHSFAEWRGSAHGRAGVGCERCHGGDPAATDPARAHAGVRPANDPTSLVHARNLPRTCGGCHKAERQAFDRSKHGKGLAAGGKAATCSLCHGPMAAALPTPRELDQRCAACHTKPVDAEAALAVMVSAKISLHRAHGAIREAGPSPRGDLLAREHELERMYREIQRQWHEFRPKEVLGRSRDVAKLADALAVEVGIRSRGPAR